MESKTKNQHDKLAVRLGIILTGLFSGKSLNIIQLATEFNVTTRTIQRDINHLLMYLPIDKQQGCYSLEKKLSTTFIKLVKDKQTLILQVHPPKFLHNFQLNQY